MNDKFEMINETDEIQLLGLKTLDLQLIENCDVDKQIIDERNADMKKLEAELTSLLDSINFMNEMIHQDSEKIEKIEENTVRSDINITSATDTVVEVIPIFQSIKEKYLALKMIGSGISAGLICGGIGFLAGGPVGVAIGTPIGAGLGTLGGWLTKFIN